MSHTGNPRHPDNPPSDPPAEPTGLVAKDSLANESIARGGVFGDNVNPEVLGVKGASSTLANTDTSGAVKLDPATSGATREGDGVTKYPDAGARADYGGTHSDQGFRGGSGDPTVASRTASGVVSDSTAAISIGSGTRPFVESAPNYAADNTTAGDLKPKGDNLVEGGDIPQNRSTYTGDVGGPKDPGRLAEQKFAQADADTSAGITREYGNVGRKGDGTAYDALNSSERA